MVTVHELIAWDLDEYLYRSLGTSLSQGQLAEAINRAKQKLSERVFYEPCRALLDIETSQIQPMLAVHAQRPELRQEYEGLDWTLGIVDLRRVLAFQRRLVFDSKFKLLQLPTQNNWTDLLVFSFGAARSTKYRLVHHGNDERCSKFSFQSSNPDLQLRLIEGTQPLDHSPFSLYGGSPFFEVAEFHGRWFLRDGYHRAYRLLEAGIYHIPAVVINARTMEEVGATQSCFFAEEQLFSSRPPRVVDFLDDHLVLHYQRRKFKKVIRISIEESLQSMDETDEVQGDEI
jgi:hypothetical protein